LCFLLCAALPAAALDFGLALSQTLKTSNEDGNPGAFSYSPAAIPWLGGPLGENFNLYLSGRVGFEYSAAFEGGDSAWRDPLALPELDRSELTWLLSPALSFTLGRQRFRDPAALAASGLYDGLSAAFSAGGSRFSAAAWYTGLLYKDTADILITSRDRQEHGKPAALDGASYFASRRALFSFEWENPGLGPRSSLALALLAQFDLNEGEERLHSQYLSGRWDVRLSGGAGLEAAAVFGAGEEQEGEAAVFFAGFLGGSWAPPGAWNGKLSLRVLYSSPSYGERLSAFVPVNSLPQGQVLSPALGGLSLVRAAYSLRPHRTLGLSAEGTYFIRTDTVSFQDSRDSDKLKSEGYFLGGELWGALQWTPLPDLALSLGGGAFFPGLGDVFEAGAEVRWKAALGVILSF
jgi:hypothetical protein